MKNKDSFLVLTLLTVALLSALLLAVFTVRRTLDPVYEKVVLMMAAAMAGCAVSQGFVLLKDTLLGNRLSELVSQLSSERFSSEEKTVEDIRRPYFFYYRSWFEKTPYWRVINLDFSERLAFGSLDGTYTICHPANPNDEYRFQVKGIVRNESLLLLIERKGEDPAYFLFPHFIGGLDKRGIAMHQVWSTETKLDPAVLSKTPLHRTADPRGFLSNEDAEKMEREWMTNFFLPKWGGVSRNDGKVQLLKNQDVFFEQLLKVTARCDEVYTHMLSDPPSYLNSAKALKYFDDIHAEIRRGRYRVFQRIASVNSPEKVIWIFETLHLLRGADCFSLAVRPVDHRSPLTSIHCCKNDDAHWTIVWPTMDTAGGGQAFSVEDAEVTAAMITEYKTEFQSPHTIKLKTGKAIDLNKIRDLAREFKLENHPRYRALVE